MRFYIGHSTAEGHRTTMVLSGSKHITVDDDLGQSIQEHQEFDFCFRWRVDNDDDDRIWQLTAGDVARPKPTGHKARSAARPERT